MATKIRAPASCGPTREMALFTAEAAPEQDEPGKQVAVVARGRPPRGRVAQLEYPRIRRGGDASEPQEPQGHDGRTHGHEYPRTVASGQPPESGREQRKEQRAGDTDEPGGRGVIADRALQKDDDEGERDIQGSIDHQR